MATYSLTLREEKGSKLTTQQLDDNFLYLQDLAQQGGGGSEGPQGPTGPQGPAGGGGGSIEVISITISVAQLTTSFTTPIEVIPAPGSGKMTVPLWGRFRMIGGGTKWGEDYFQILPQTGLVSPGSIGYYFGSNWLGTTNSKFYSLQTSGQNDSDYDYPINESWVLAVSDDYVNTQINVSSVAAFEVGDVITGSQSGATASVVLALPVDKGNQEIYVNNVNGSFTGGETITGVPSGGQGTLGSVSNPQTPGDYGMELYLGYQTFDLL